MSEVIGIYPTDKKDIWSIMDVVNNVVDENKVKFNIGFANFLTCTFFWNGNFHSMNIEFNRNEDYFNFYPGPKIIFSISSFDKDANEIIKKILEKFSIDRKCYLLNKNDGRIKIDEILYNNVLHIEIK